VKPALPSKELLESIAWHQEQARGAFRASLLANYIFEPEDARADLCLYMIPSRHVYRKIADEFQIAVIPREFKSWVKQGAEELGAVHFKYNGMSFLRGIRQIDLCVEVAKENTLRFKREARFPSRSRVRALGYETNTPRQVTRVNWEEILKREGLPAEINSLGIVDAARATMNEARIATATEAMWRVYRDFCILRLYCDGLSIIGIATKLNIGRKLVWNRLKHYDLTTTEK